MKSRTSRCSRAIMVWAFHSFQFEPLSLSHSMLSRSFASSWSVVGRKMVLYVNCLQRPNWWPEHAFTIVLKSAMNLTHKNQGFYYNSGGRIKSWNFRSAPNVVVHILENQINSYDSNGVIAASISTLGDEKRNLPFFCLPILPRNPLNVLGHIIRRWKDNFKENTTPLES